MPAIHMLHGWLRVPYDGAPNAKLVLTVDGEDVPAFYDCDVAGCWAQARIVPSRGARVTLTVDGRRAVSGRVR